MQGLFRRVAASIIAIGLLAPQAGSTALARAAHTDNTIAQARPPGHVMLNPPLRIHIDEPPHARAATQPDITLRPTVVSAVRPTHSTPAVGPSMARPNEIDARLKASARRRTLSAPMSIAVHAGGAARRPGAPANAALPTSRRAQSLPGNSSASGTGINPWWRYQEQSLPGGGQLMVNVGTGNLLIQDADMAVPHKGMTMAVRRTFNSQNALTTMAGTTPSRSSLYGNGWTNTFDAHIVATSSGMSIYDINGARYDYVSSGGGWVSATAGQHATLYSDGGCGMMWFTMSGTMYYFYMPTDPGTCPQLGAFAGRIYQILGRNRNTYITFGYGFDNNDYSVNGKVSLIRGQTESGLTANLWFADVNGRRLLQQLVFPDNATSVSYGYDSLGNLTSVSRPPNNAAGTRPVHGYGYQTLGSGSIMSYVTSPRWNGSDGGYTVMAYAGTDVPSSTLSGLAHVGVMNPVVIDGISSGALQSGYPTGPTVYLYEWYQTGVATPTFRDSDGHYTNWVVDGLGRPTQTQTCTATTGIWTCSGTLLATNETWDANNNRTAIVNPLGGETDAAYDAAGNVVAIAPPPQYQGWARPTTLLDYDAFNNVIGTCDAVKTHSGGADWTGQYSAGLDNYCASLFGTAGHQRRQYTYPSYEPYGELTSITSPSGYTRTISYDVAAQGGTDYGLATRISGTAIQQFDNTTRQPSTSVTYDANGNIVCQQGDSSSAATTVRTYDSLNRLIATADPDDASMSGACGMKIPGIAGSSIVTTRSYNGDGSEKTTTTPSESALAYGTLFTYDLDGNPLTEAPFHPDPQSPQTARIKRWFDSADRLVETQQPADPGTTGDIPISLRFIYDLSQGGSATTISGPSVTAHGNLFETQKNTPTGWIDFTFSAFDAMDRVTTAYAFAPCPAQTASPRPAGAIYCSQPAFATRYDWDSSSSLNANFPAPGLLVATLDGMGASRQYAYDGLNEVASINYAGDGSVTTPVSYAYDFDGRLSVATNLNTARTAPAQNRVSYTYTADGPLSVVQNSSLNTTIGYSYYADAMLASVSATGTSYPAGPNVNQPYLQQYAYRNDGLFVKEAFGVSNQSVSSTFTFGGRMTAMTDFNSGSPSVTAQYADGHGRLSSYTTPAGTYGSFSYDSRGRMVQYSDPYTSVDTEIVGTQYNIRGDLNGRTYQPNAGGKPGFQYRNVQGVLVQNATDQYDGRTGAPLILASSGSAMTYDQVGRLATAIGSLGYDAESRLVSGDTTFAARGSDLSCNAGGQATTFPATEVSYLYDAQGQLFQDQSTTGQTVNIRQWFWDGKKPLFNVNLYPTGLFKAMVNGYNADGLGSIAVDGTSPGLTVTDSDFDGAISGYHNSSGHSAWGANNPYRQWCVGFTDTLGASSNYVGPNNVAPVDDSSSDTGFAVSSTGRVFLSSSMGYTTPDYSSATPYSSNSRETSSDEKPCNAGPPVAEKSVIGCLKVPCLKCLFDDIAAAFGVLYNAYFFNVSLNAENPRPLSSREVTRAVVKAGSQLCPTSVSVFAGLGGPRTGGLTLTNRGDLLGNVGLSRGVPPIPSASAVVGFGEPPAPWTVTSTISVFAGPGGDANTSVWPVQGGTTFDAGVGIPTAAGSLTATLPLRKGLPVPPMLCANH